MSMKTWKKVKVGLMNKLKSGTRIKLKGNLYLCIEWAQRNELLSSFNIKGDISFQFSSCSRFQFFHWSQLWLLSMSWLTFKNLAKLTGKRLQANETLGKTKVQSFSWFEILLLSATVTSVQSVGRDFRMYVIPCWKKKKKKNELETVLDLTNITNRHRNEWRHRFQNI